jgi:hypothetical protein
VPLDNEKQAQMRADGNPHPGFWEDNCGQTTWFSGVSGMLTPVPSTTITRRLFSRPVSGIALWYLAVESKTSLSVWMSSFLRAVQ